MTRAPEYVWNEPRNFLINILKQIAIDNDLHLCQDKVKNFGLEFSKLVAIEIIFAAERQP